MQVYPAAFHMSKTTETVGLQEEREVGLQCMWTTSFFHTSFCEILFQLLCGVVNYGIISRQRQWKSDAIRNTPISTPVG